MINIKFFDTNLLKIDKKPYKSIDIYYITIKNVDDYENIYSVNLLYLIIGELDGCIEEKSGSKYFVFDSMELHSTDENKEVLKKYAELWDGIKNEIKTIIILNDADRHTEESNVIKDVIFTPTEKSKEALKNYKKFWEETKRQIEVINDDEPIEYRKDFIKIKCESDDDLPLGKTFNILLIW